jgi:DNA repair protein RecO (recombination protein O)
VKVDLNPAFILHQRPYRETSVLLDVFSQQQGRIKLIAKGIRQHKRSKQGQFQLYQPLLLSWYGHGDLQNLNASEPFAPRYILKADASLCGLYINELLVRLLPLNESETEVFDAYQQVLTGLQETQNTENSEVILRLFEKRLLMQLGYGLALDKEVETDREIEDEQRYYYQPDAGLFRWQQGQKAATISGRSLQHLIDETGFDQQSLTEIKQLMRSVIHYYLGGKPLQSRQLFFQLQQYAAKT